ncbi:MAG: helix-turn-helix transcriptional regulator [Geminicoccaceae bacterium]
MAIQTADHTDAFTVLDRAYGLIDGSAAWSDCLEALIDMASIEASRLFLYDCGRGQSQIIEAAGLGIERGRAVQHCDLDEALWQSAPGDVWLPPDDNPIDLRSPRLKPLGYAVLDRDSVHILYIEFLHARTKPAVRTGPTSLLQTVLPHLHRACRLYRSITGDDLATFAAPDLSQPTSSAGMPIELRLRRRFRLSKAEARVATLLADGLAPRMIADRLNVSIHTVRSQLQAIFSKTDTSRQAELTSLILRETEIPRAICQTGAVAVEQGERPSCP